MSLRYEILADSVLKGLSREFPVFGNPEHRADAARSIRAAFDPGKTDAENREALRAKARQLAENTRDDGDKPAGSAEFYAINVLTMDRGAVVSVATRWVAVTEDITLEAAERLVARMESRNGTESRVLSVGVSFEEIEDGKGVMFLHRPGREVAVKGILTAATIRRMALAAT